ncbi:GrpB family protein [Streptomyces griseorubiginosus]|uniref:GrpB family protein n=1 Tax=Streptomyces griseorubiginosus TaxID=67304 RepID=UPI003AF36A8A
MSSPWGLCESEHIGSTAVPGPAAGPVIELMAAVYDLSHTPVLKGRAAGRAAISGCCGTTCGRTRRKPC